MAPDAAADAGVGGTVIGRGLVGGGGGGVGASMLGTGVGGAVTAAAVAAATGMGASSGSPNISSSQYGARKTSLAVPAGLYID